MASTERARELNRLALNVRGARDIIRLAGEAGIRIPELLPLASHPANGVIRAFIPGNVCLAIHDRPGPMMDGSNVFRSVAGGFQRDVEIVAVASAQRPLSEEVTAARQIPGRHSRCACGSLELD